MNTASLQLPSMAATRIATHTLLVFAAWLPTAAAAQCEAWYRFDGNLDDASANGYHGLMIPADTDPAPQFAEGKNGQALRITAGSAMHSFIDLHHEFCPQVTITAWFRLASVDATDNQFLFSTGDGDGPGLYFQDGAIRVEGTGNGILRPNSVQSADAWWFVAVVYDYEKMIYHLDWRSRIVPGQLTDPLNAAEDAFWIGTYNDSMSYTAQDLYVDDLRIHAGALSTEEIRAVSAGTTTAPTATPVADKSSTTPLPACQTHADCPTGTYCAFDDKCHPDRHLQNRQHRLSIAG